MKYLITLEVTNAQDFRPEDIARLVCMGAGEECDDQFRDLQVVTVVASEIELCSKCGKYMDVHDVWDRCPKEVAVKEAKL